MNAEIGHPIKVASRRSGLTSHVIRVWEKRYSAVSPTRTASNRRLYTDADIEHLRLLHEAISAGHSIGQIASLADADLLSLIKSEKKLDSTSQPTPPIGSNGAHTVRLGAHGGNGKTRPAPPIPDPPQNDSPYHLQEGEIVSPTVDPAIYVERCLDAVQRFDADGLERELARASVPLSQLRLFEEVVEPLMYRIGNMWRDGHLRIADEHLAAAVVRRFVDSLRAAFPAPPSSPHIIATTPVGQLHEIGALVVSAQAAREGWRVTYLGSNLPAQEIARAAHQNRAPAVALSLAYPEDDPHLGGELVKLRRCLPEETALLVGGRAAGRQREVLQRIGATYLPDLSALRETLAELRAQSQSHILQP